MGACITRGKPPQYVAPIRCLTPEGTQAFLGRLETLAPDTIALNCFLALFPIDLSLDRAQNTSNRLKGVARTVIDAGWYRETHKCLVKLDHLLSTVDTTHCVGDLVVGALNLGPFIL